MKAFTDLSHWPIHNQLVYKVGQLRQQGLAVYDESYATCVITGHPAQTSSLTTGVYWQFRLKKTGKRWQAHQLVTDFSRWPEAVLPEYLALSPKVDRLLRPEVWHRAGGLASVNFPHLSLSGFSPDR